MKCFVLLACLWLPSITAAATRDDYARQWPLTLSREDAGAYRVVLDDAIYGQLQDPQLLDLDVRDGKGVTVPADLFGPELPLGKPPRRVQLPWFALPAAAGVGASQGWELISQADADGHLRRVETRIIDSAIASVPRSALLIDLSRVREAIVALQLQWQPVDALDLGYTVEASDDLEHWQPLATRGRLVDLHRDGVRLLHQRIELYGLLPQYQRARYLRLMPDRRDQPLQITRIDAELAAATTAPTPQWRELHGKRAAREGHDTFEFVLDGRFPVQQADVALPGNHAVEWRLESRDRSDADWRPRVAPWVAYQVNAAGRGNQSPPQPLRGTIRDRYWRLVANNAVRGEPTLRLGYHAEALVFLAEGTPPYTLVAGSAQAQRAQSPLTQLVAVLRRQHGASWQPSPAYLGEPRTLGGDAALAPQRDWKSWLLWAVLGLGVLVVAGFAMTVLRKVPAPTPRD